MKLAIWVKGKDGRYKVNPHLEIADKLHLLKKMPDGSLGCIMDEKMNNPMLYKLIEEHRNHFVWEPGSLDRLERISWNYSQYRLRQVT